jgi:hypothetical protein
MISAINRKLSVNKVTSLSLRRKMKLTKKQLISAAIVTVLAGGIGLSTVSNVSAQQDQKDGGDSIAQRIATKFNLNKDEVKAEIDAQHEEDHTAREAEMKQNRETQLQELVDSGKITADQKTAIIAKEDETHTKMEELRNNGKTREENKEAHKALHDEFKTWVESQNISMDDIRPADGPEGMGRGHHGPMDN